MAQPIDFYFDFSSPYAYFASHRIDPLAERFGRSVAWKPIMIGPAFRASGNKPLIEQPLKGEYSRRDWERMGRLMKVDWVLPTPFPITALLPTRAFWWLDGRDPAAARRFARGIFHAYFGEGRDASTPAVVASVAQAQGLEPEALLAAAAEPAWKQRAKDESEAAIGRGVFGAPFFFVDGEAFWGADRLWMVEEWLKRGGW